ncbi:MAG: DUF4974 domain-containing protein [Tannerellaceae bacterium]|jgi:ferric-dicitrate binding protein FerR (iron transport regulator)|nr:DUF4974 domain-containing protein [Tannerellaceae bacterium]
MSNTKNDILNKIEILKALDEDIRENRCIDVSEGYRNTLSKIKKRSLKQSVYQTFSKVAAILIIPLLSSTLILFYLFVHQRNEMLFSDVAYTEITAAPGSVVKTLLPDNSEVWLNSGSRLRYPSVFSGEKREVELSGEAFFDVQTNKAFPFEVALPHGIKITAKGTAFNINTYDDKIYEIALRNGLVDITLNSHSVSLLPEEMAKLNVETGQVGKTAINIEEKTGWKDGLLIFRNTPLAEVLKQLARRYNVEFSIHNNASVNYRIHATFSTETITQILNVLKLAAPISWSVKEMEQQGDSSFSKQHVEIVIK